MTRLWTWNDEECDDEPTEIEYFSIRITTIHYPTQVEHLCSIVNFSPESILESFLLGFECRGCLDEIEMGENGDDFRQTMRSEGGKCFERFLQECDVSKMNTQMYEKRANHLKAKTPIDH